MKTTLDLIIVEDSEDDARLLIRELTRGGYAVTARRVETEEDLRAELARESAEAVVSDYALPRFSGAAALKIVRESGRDLPFIFVSATMGEDIAVSAMKAGAHDYVMKSNLTRLVPAIERELRDAIERRQHREAEKQMRMSEHKYRHLFRSMTDAALLVGADSDRIIDANEQAEILFGRSRDDLLGLTTIELYTPSQSGTLAPPTAGGSPRPPENAESMVERADGTSVFVHISVSQIQLYERPFLLILFRDITARKRAESALRDVLRHAHTIIANAIVTAPAGWTSDTPGWSVANFKWQWHFPDEKSAQEVLPLDVAAGKRYQDCWDTAKHPDDLAPMAAVATRAFATGASAWEQEFRCVDCRGVVHSFTQAAAIEVLDGKRWRVTTVSTDITERVAAQKALRTSEDRLSRIFQISPTAISIVRTSDGRFVETNEAFVNGSGYSRAEILGHTAAELQLWNDPEERAQVMREVDQHGTVIAFKLKYRRKSGEVAVGLSSMTKIMLNGEEHLLSVIQDITELERAEEARSESDRRFRQVAENINEVFWLKNLDDGGLIYVSPAYECMWGRTLESIYGEPLSWLDAVRSEDRARVSAALPLQPSGNYDIEYRITRPDGSVRWINERAFPVKNSVGNTYRIAGVASDITQRRELEEQFRQSQKMEAIGQLAGGIAHDFNNLLTVIQMQSSLLIDDLKAEREAVVGIRQIMDAATRAANLTRQLLTFSRRQTHAARSVDLGEVLGTVTKMLRRIVGEDISIESRFAPGIPPVNADPGMMEQVLMNLAVNARDAMPTGGRLMISLDTTMVDAEDAASHPPAKPGRYVCLTVRDTGCGIPAEIRSRIFEPFFTTKEVGKGTGLGLATVFGIVQQHHGWIELESELGKGSAFRVLLPALVETKAAESPAEAVAPVRGGTESILLVEDDTIVRGMAGAALRRNGYRVYDAGNVREALKCWEETKGKVDLLLTDLIMPGGLSGKDLAEQLALKAPSLRTIFTTGYGSSAIGRKLKLVAGLNYLEKPYSFNDLATIVRRRLDQPATLGNS